MLGDIYMGLDSGFMRFSSLASSFVKFILYSRFAGGFTRVKWLDMAYVPLCFLRHFLPKLGDNPGSF